MYVAHHADYAAHKAKGLPPYLPPPIVKATPPQWPKLLLPLKLFAVPEDKGLGDIIARKIGPIGGDLYKAWYLKVFGKSCGCSQRQEDWNRNYPLNRL